MYVLIVDDDALIRKWLAMLLKEIPDREITVRMAENGIEALEIIQSGHSPDLLITDIKMPKMDGLTLCQHVRQSYPQLPVVMLSSYAEFSFVKKALQLGAIDYILKVDMRVEDLSAIVEKAEAYRKKQSYQQSDVLAGEVKRRMLNSYLKDDRTDDQTFLLRLDAQMTMESLVLMMIRTDRNIDHLLGTFPDRELPVHAVLVPYCEMVYVAFIRVDAASPDVHQKENAVRQFLNGLRRQSDFGILAWATILNCNETGIYTGIQSSRSVLDFKYYYSLENFEKVSYHESGECSPAADIPAYKKFFEVATRYQVQEATELLRECLDIFHHTYFHPEDIEKYMSLMCHKLLADISVLEIGTDCFDRTLQRLHEVSSAKTQQLREQALEDFVSQYAHLFSAARGKRPEAVLQALDYIEAHYAEKITLDQVANYAFMNSTYMSELFKKEMGITLNDYINNLRIIHACEYIRFSDCSMAQVAEYCGFSDQNYFTKVFKKIVGKTPSQYRGSFAS